MLIITCPNNNIPERTYIIKLLLNELLGYEVTQNEIYFDNSVKDYILCCDEKKVIIEDHFFNKYPQPFSYIRKNNLPNSLEHFHGLGLNIPIIYGVDKFETKDDCVTIGLDVFASSFFMLTRWEESLYGREEKGDCDENELFCVKHHVHTRPIVHEYEKLLRQLLTGSLIADREYKVVLTHDVDAINTPTWAQIIKCVIRNKRINSLTYNSTLSRKDVLLYKSRFPDVYSQTKLYVELSKKYHVPEWFYLKVCSKGERGYTYDYRHQRTKDYVNKLSSEHGGDIVLGFHPSQLTFNNTEQWKIEVARINSLLNHQPGIGRNHHLLYNCETLRNWSKLNEHTLENTVSISNCVFHKHIGFRSGIAVPYPVFDIIERRQLNLLEYPCVIMDTALIQSDYINGYDAWDEITKVINEVKNNNGILVLTWHILIRELSLFDEYFQLCENTINYATKQIQESI